MVRAIEVHFTQNSLFCHKTVISRPYASVLGLLSRQRMKSLCLSLILLILFAGCSTSHNNSGIGGLSGNWQITLTRSDTNAVKVQTGFLLQTGTSLSGEVLLTQTGCAGTGTASGQVRGSNVSMSVSQTGQTINFTGTAGSGNSSMTGQYSLLASGCGNTQIGTWNAVRVAPLTGTLSSTFTSQLTPGVTMHFSGKINEGQNTGQSNAALSGNMTSTDSPPCYTNMNIVGQVSGTAIVMTLVAPDGTVLGSYQGTGTVDMTSITGRYSFFNAHSDVLGNCGTGDYGTGTTNVGS